MKEVSPDSSFAGGWVGTGEGVEKGGGVSNLVFYGESRNDTWGNVSGIKLPMRVAA